MDSPLSIKQIIHILLSSNYLYILVDSVGGTLNLIDIKHQKSIIPDQHLLDLNYSSLNAELNPSKINKKIINNYIL